MTLAEARRRLQLWLDAEEALASGGQSYTIGGRTLTRMNLDAIRERVTYYTKLVDGLDSGRGAGVRIFRVMPRDL